jgi:hypothetical protein
MLAETQIMNLLYRYAECIDAGDLAGAAALFEHARVRIGGSDTEQDTIDAARLLGIWKSLIVLHPDGTPTSLDHRPSLPAATTTNSSVSTASGGFPTATSHSSTWLVTSAAT